LQANINYTKVHFFDQSPLLVSTTLNKLEGRLDSTNFIRVNRKFLVNTAFVKNYRITRDKDYVELRDGSVISPSRRGKMILRAFFNPEVNVNIDSQ
jgi:DNA-binding LytR/AlgR family response regulator